MRNIVKEIDGQVYPCNVAKHLDPEKFVLENEGFYFIDFPLEEDKCYVVDNGVIVFSEEKTLEKQALIEAEKQAEKDRLLSLLAALD